jgi:hypothetical protein
MLATFRLKDDFYLREERVEIERLVVCLCCEYDFVDAAIGKGICEGDCRV